MDDLTRKARNAYMRDWRKRNPEKVQATFERFYRKKAAELAEIDRQCEPEFERGNSND